VRKHILIVDDMVSIRMFMRSLLERAGLPVCGEASNGVEAVEAALRLKPDLILLDYSMPKMNGAEAASILKDHLPEVRIILFTLHAHDALQALEKAINVDLVLAKLDGMDNLIVHIKTLLDIDSKAASA